MNEWANKQIKRNMNAIIIACINKYGDTHNNNKHHILLYWLEASGGKVMNKIATIDLDKERGSQEAR